MSPMECEQLSNLENETEGNSSSKIKNSHPLLIDVVLNGIFKYLKVEDLKQCRTVCSLWNSSVLASSSWKLEVKVHVSRRQGRTDEAFMELVEVGNGMCFSENYSIHVSTIPQLFWSQCGTWIKILRLRDVKFGSKDEFRAIVYNACPYMEQLSLSYMEISASENDQAEELEPSDFAEPKFEEQKNMKYLAVSPFKESESNLWMELLRHFPNLEALHILCSNANCSLSGFFNSLSNFRQKFPTKLKLKHISVITSGDPYPELFQILKDPGLRLQTINTNYLCELDDLREVLNMHAPFLKKLRFRFIPFNRIIDPYQIFPLQSAKACYYGLDGLQVLDFQSSRLSKTFLSLAILKFTRNLRMLKLDLINDAIIANTQSLEMGGVSLKMCKRLILHVHYNMPLSLKKLVTWLPNVEELEFRGLTNDYFQIVCETWPCLVALVAGTTVDDMGITGLDKQDVCRINHNGESSDWRPITVPRANISALKDLRSLYIRSEIYNREMGYCAAIRGFELVPKLERLSLLGYRFTGGSIWERVQSRFSRADDHLKVIEDLSDAIWE